MHPSMPAVIGACGTTPGVRTCVRMSVIAVLLPRFELSVAAGGGAALLRGPVALAPEPGTGQAVGEVSAAAEAFGGTGGHGDGGGACALPAACARAARSRRGGRGVGGAARAPGGGRRRRGAGAAGARLLRRRRAARPAWWKRARVIAAAARALRRPARIGAGPGAFCTLAAASRARVGRPAIVDGGRAEARAHLAPLEIALLALRERTAPLVEPLERLGVATLGELAALPRDAVADRFGLPGLHAHDLANGHDAPLASAAGAGGAAGGARAARGGVGPPAGARPRAARGPHARPPRAAGADLARGRPERRARRGGDLARAGRPSARPLADPARMRLALGARLVLLPAPAEALRLTVESFGPPVTDQGTLLDEAAAEREARLRDAVRQTRALAGGDATLRVVEVDPGSRVPERRTLLAPFEGPEPPDRK